MAAPLYFFPRLTLDQLAPGGRLSAALLAATDTAAVFGDIESVREQTARFESTGPGPGGLSGVYLAANPPHGAAPHRIGYFPDFQTWTEAIPESLWIGLDKEHPPTPADLARPRQYRGEAVRLAGSDWLIPVVRSPHRMTLLPCDLFWDAAGQVRKRIKARYAQAWEDAGDAFDLFYNPETAGSVAGGLARALEIAVGAIGLNYRYGRHEQNGLGLVDNENWEDVLAALADVPFVRAALAAEKKSEHLAADAGPNTPPG